MFGWFNNAKVLASLSNRVNLSRSRAKFSGSTLIATSLPSLDDPKLKDGLKLFWFATGKDDFLVETSRATVEMFKKHQFDVVYVEGNGGHTWDNWRDYLHVFAPQLFQ